MSNNISPIAQDIDIYLKDTAKAANFSDLHIEKSAIRVLHLVGSVKNQFYFDLSLTYASQCDGCIDLDRHSYEYFYAVVHLDGSWSFPESLDKQVVKGSQKMSKKDAIKEIYRLEIDVMVPHMFCVQGMTYYRSLFDKLGIPFIGNKEHTINLAYDKEYTKKALIKSGCRVPNGEVLVKGINEYPTKFFQIPCLVKPCDEDNSFGLSLVKDKADLQKAIELAFDYSNRVMVEEFIRGREVRVGVIEEQDGTLTVLPKLEYFVREIRKTEDKLAMKDGKLTDNPQSDVKKEGDRQCPADFSHEIDQRIDNLAKKAHKALKSNDYSLWDMRLDEKGFPYILEACPFCSFSPWSVMSGMANKSEREDLFHPKMFEMF